MIEQVGQLLCVDRQFTAKNNRLIIARHRCTRRGRRGFLALARQPIGDMALPFDGNDRELTRDIAPAARATPDNPLGYKTVRPDFDTGPMADRDAERGQQEPKPPSMRRDR